MHILRHSSSIAGVPALVVVLSLCLFFSLSPPYAEATSSTQQPLRVVLNDAAFRKNETDIMKELVQAEDGFELVDVVTTRNRNVTSGFDYLLTNRKGAAAAYGSGGVVSIVPGLASLTHKALMTRTLQNVPGVAPQSFRIPFDLDRLNRYIDEHPDEGEDIWVMKENKHRGQGVTPVQLKDVIGKMVFAMKANKGRNPVVLVQKFVEDQLLLDDVPFTFRIWTVRWSSVVCRLSSEDAVILTLTHMCGCSFLRRSLEVDWIRLGHTYLMEALSHLGTKSSPR